GRLTSAPPFPERLHFFVLALPLTALAIQSPLWFFRGYLGWRLVRVNRQEPSTASLSIADYFRGTAIAAAAIACAKLARNTDASDAYWPIWGIFFASAAGASLISVVPAMLL